MKSVFTRNFLLGLCLSLLHFIVFLLDVYPKSASETEPILLGAFIFPASTFFILCLLIVTLEILVAFLQAFFKPKKKYIGQKLSGFREKLAHTAATYFYVTGYYFLVVGTTLYAFGLLDYPIKTLRHPYPEFGGGIEFSIFSVAVACLLMWLWLFAFGKIAEELSIDLPNSIISQLPSFSSIKKVGTTALVTLLTSLTGWLVILVIQRVTPEVLLIGTFASIVGVFSKPKARMEIT